MHVGLSTPSTHDSSTVVVSIAFNLAISSILGTTGNGPICIASTSVGHARSIVKQISRTVKVAIMGADFLVLRCTVACALVFGTGVNFAGSATTDIGQTRRQGVCLKSAVANPFHDAVVAPATLKISLVDK